MKESRMSYSKAKDTLAMLKKHGFDENNTLWGHSARDMRELKAECERIVNDNEKFTCKQRCL